MMRKKQIIKIATSKDAEFRGRIDERTKYIIEVVNEIKEHSTKFEEKVDKKFEDLDTCICKKFTEHREKIDNKFLEINKCIDEKFDGHNEYHIKLERKYTKLFIGLVALTIGGLASNPSGVVYLASKILLILKFLIGLL